MTEGRWKFSWVDDVGTVRCGEVDGVVFGLRYNDAKRACELINSANEKAVAQAREEGRRARVMRDALESISKNTCCEFCQEAALVAKAALDDLK